MIHRVRRAALVAAVAVLVVACGGNAPAIQDPNEILVKAIDALQQAKSFQLRADFSGSLPLDLGGGSGQPLDLSGTTLEGAVDLANGRARLSFSAPTLLNTTGELLVVDKVAYLKVSFMGPKYHKSDVTSSPGEIGVPTDPKASLDKLRAELDKLKTPPQKLANERCGDTDCYHVRLILDPASMNLGSQTGRATLDVWVRTTDLRPAKLQLTADGGSQGTATLTAELFGYDEPVAVEPPPPDQVEEGTLPFPSP